MMWRDGTRAELTLDVTTAEAHACLEPPPFPPRLSLPATAHAVTSDGRVDTNLVVDLFGPVDEANRVTRVELIANGNFAPAEDFETRYGITGIDATGQDRIVILFTSSYDISGSTPPTGALEVVGTVSVECDPAPPDAMGTPACNPNGPTTTLDSATW
jgi:hypothetical protein